MQTVTTIKNLAAVIKHWKRLGLSIALVPTMGNLHAGHLKLVSEAKAKADKVVVSIFVNPTQFSMGEDFDTYPRTHSQDAALLAALDVDVLFLPGVTEIYPSPIRTLVSVSVISDLHCGVSRPRHFDGVLPSSVNYLISCNRILLFLAKKIFNNWRLFAQWCAI